MLSLSAAHVHLLVAILAEVVATSSLKASDGLSRPLPTAVVVIGYAVAFYFLALALRSVPVGLAYAIWSGVGSHMIIGPYAAGHCTEQDRSCARC